MALIDGRDGVGRNPGREVDAHMVVGLQRRWTDVRSRPDEPQWSILVVQQGECSRVFAWCESLTFCTLAVPRLGTEYLLVVGNKAEPREATGELGVRHGQGQQEGGSGRD